MNNVVRIHLINLARQKDKFIYYSDLNIECNLGYDLNTETGLALLRKTMAEVSEYENTHHRPLLSSLIIYKDKAKNDHGDGFYKLAETLGFGSSKRLKEDLFGFHEAEKCRQFWQNEENYSEFSSISIDNVDKALAPSNYFTQEDLDFFDKWQMMAYNKQDEEHVKAKNTLMATVWEKTMQLGKLIVKQLENFEATGGRYWNQRGWKEMDGENVQAAIFKPYTWVKVYKKGDGDKDIFFTFGIDADAEAFVYKLDCQNQRDSKLTSMQIVQCKSLIPENARWKELAYADMLSLDWNSLVKICVDFIKQCLPLYDDIISSVWKGASPAASLRDRLIKRDKPEGKHSELPEIERTFNEVDIEYERLKQAQKDLGDKGEALVKLNEILYLKSINRNEEADKVIIVKDGKGYDVLSFDDEGNEKYIEVKTTTGSKYSTFYLSQNEFDFMKFNKGKYVIYRIYNYNESLNNGEFFEVKGHCENQLLFQPIQYKVHLRKV